MDDFTNLTTKSSLRPNRTRNRAPEESVESFCSYVPRMVIQQYLDNPQFESPADAKPDSFPAAVLFADISGL
jgi:hypothetical protein